MLDQHRLYPSSIYAQWLPKVTDNHPPVADAYSRHRAGYIGYFTANDYDPDHDPLTFSIITQPSHGTLTFDYGYVNDRPWYTPAAGFFGQDTLVYQICDPSNACATATVTITVPNQTPVAVNDNASLHNPGYLGYLTANDSDPEGDPLTFLVITQPSHGTLSYDYGPNYPRPWYTPATGYSGPDSLVYRICDDFNACATATVTINVTNQAPVARDDKYSVTGPGYIGYFFGSEIRSLTNSKKISDASPVSQWFLAVQYDYNGDIQNYYLSNVPELMT